MVSLLLPALHSIWESSHMQISKHYLQLGRDSNVKPNYINLENSTELPKLPTLLETILSLVQSHPNLFIFLLLVAFSAYFSLFFNKFKIVSRRDTVSPAVSSSSSPEFKPSNFCPSPMTCASSSDCVSLSSFSCSSVLDHLIDNGNFDRYFKVHSSLHQDLNQRSVIAEHKLDGQKYLIQVRDFESSNDKIESLLISEVSKYKNIRCRGVPRYVTSWVEENFGIVSLYMQMERIEGSSLKGLMKDGIDAQLAVKVMKKIAKVIKFLHDCETVHGGIDLDNVFLDQYEKVVVGQIKFVGSFEDDLIMFKKVKQDLLEIVHEEQVELAKRLVSEDRWVKKLDIYQ